MLARRAAIVASLFSGSSMDRNAAVLKFCARSIAGWLTTDLPNDGFDRYSMGGFTV